MAHWESKKKNELRFKTIIFMEGNQKRHSGFCGEMSSISVSEGWTSLFWSLNQYANLSPITGLS